MKLIRRSDFADLVLMLAILIGAFMRFNPTMLAGFAINDGGMFAVMVDDLRTSRYMLPVFTTYNHLNIPFAYPPLGFYLGRIAADLFGLSAPEASVRKMSEKDAAAHAAAIFEMFLVVAAEYEAKPHLRIVSKDDGDTVTDDLFEVPSFLSRA